MEFLYKTYDDVLISNDANRISSVLADSKHPSTKYPPAMFLRELVLFTQENADLLSLGGTFKEDLKEDYDYSKIKKKDAFLKSVEFLINDMPYTFSNFIADILLAKGLSEKRPNLDRSTDRATTEAGMFDHSLVDKSELMFL